MIVALETVGRPPSAASLERIESPWKIPEAGRILALFAEMTTADPPRKNAPASSGGARLDGAAAEAAGAAGRARRGESGAAAPAFGAESAGTGTGTGTTSAAGKPGMEAVGAFFAKVNWKNERRTLSAPAAPPVGSPIDEAAAPAFDGAAPVGRQSVRQFFAHANWRNQTTVAEPVPTAPEPMVLPQRAGSADRLAATSVLASFQWD